MAAGLWRQHELDRYSFEDLLDIHELLDVRAENERRAHEWAEEHKNDGR